MAEHKRYTPEFFAWAREHGWPSRGPRGSEVNKVRARMLPGLYRQWLKEQREQPIDFKRYTEMLSKLELPPREEGDWEQNVERVNVIAEALESARERQYEREGTAKEGS